MAMNKDTYVKSAIFFLILLGITIALTLNFSLTGNATSQGTVNFTIGPEIEEPTPEPPSSTGGGGGGVGSSPVTPTICEPEWRCYEVGSCNPVDNQFNDGIIGENFRLLVRDKCYAFDFEEENCGYKEFECVDLNSCNDNSTIPLPWEACDINGPTCSDGILNQGEADIDCGGPCRACQEVPLTEIRIVWIPFFIIFLLILLILLFLIIKLYYDKKKLEERQTNERKTVSVRPIKRIKKRVKRR